LGQAGLGGAYILITDLLQDPAIKDASPTLYLVASNLFWPTVVVSGLGFVIASLTVIAWSAAIALATLDYSYAAGVALFIASAGAVLNVIGFALFGTRTGRAINYSKMDRVVFEQDINEKSNAK